jgi:hypothetical protein
VQEAVALLKLNQIERIRELTTYGNNSFGLLLFALTYAKCTVPTRREQTLNCTEPRRIVEIGYYLGYSAIMFASAIAASSHPGKVVSVDIVDRPQGRQAMSIQGQLAQLHTLIIGDSRKVINEVLAQLDGPIDLLLIDGDHSYEGCRSDFENYMPHVAEDGLVLFHDNYFPPIRQVLEQCSGWGLVNLAGWAGLTVASRTAY